MQSLSFAKASVGECPSPRDRFPVARRDSSVPLPFRIRFRNGVGDHSWRVKAPDRARSVDETSAPQSGISGGRCLSRAAVPPLIGTFIPSPAALNTTAPKARRAVAAKAR